MSAINAVLGKIESPGKTLIHEHILIGFPGWYLDTRQPSFKREEALVRVCAAFDQLKDYGVETVVDPCPSDLGRDVEFIAEVSSRTGINLICAAGFYYEKAGAAYSIRTMEVEEITDILINELENGVAETGIKPGILKIATGEGAVTDYERKVLTAAGKAAAATGTPLLSHTEKCTCGHDQIDIITAEGVAARHLLVGHSDGTDDYGYQKSLAERGVYVGFDRFGLEGQVTDETRIQHLSKLVSEGYRDQIMMSHDYVNCWLGRVPGMPAGMTLDSILPNWDMTHIFERIIPALRLEGMDDDDFDVILKDNPCRFFGG